MNATERINAILDRMETDTPPARPYNRLVAIGVGAPVDTDDDGMQKYDDDGGCGSFFRVDTTASVDTD
jgi:hypothetical protein